jgi:hypothetical protein
MRNENEIKLSFRLISWNWSSLLRERSLKRGQLPSFLYLTWLSLPFQYFSFIVVFATYSCSFGTGIYALSLCRNLNDLKGVFLLTGGGKRAGGFEDPGSDVNTNRQSLWTFTFEFLLKIFPGLHPQKRHSSSSGGSVPEYQKTEDHQHQPGKQDGNTDEAFNRGDDFRQERPDRVTSKDTQNNTDDQCKYSHFIHVFSSHQITAGKI